MEPFVPGSGGHDFSPRVGGNPGFLRRLLDTLVASEASLVAVMVREGVWAALPLETTEATGTPSGDLEWGTVLFLLNHTHLIADETVRLLADAFEAALAVAGVALPPTALTPAHYALLDAHRVVDNRDGSLLGLGPYELYDQKWLASFFNLARSVIEGRLAGNGVLPIPAAAITIAPKNNHVTIGLLSDWGTGDTTAAAVIAALAARDPDLVVHGGDVYYSGTPSAGPFAPRGEEARNLVAPWPASLAGRSFALNSNHEMYSGALGYFAALATPVFVAQGGTSMFRLRIGDWNVLGLDTAYHADPLGLYMYGSLGADQLAWITREKPDPSRTIVLTHHNALDVGLDPASVALYAPLWSGLRAALGGDPYAWYWGHVHNGIVYADPARVGPDFSTTTRCRCLGHGALPYGYAADLAGHPGIVWQAATRTGTGAELANGFATLEFELDADNNVAAVTESFFDTADPAARYRNRIYAAPVS